MNFDAVRNSAGMPRSLVRLDSLNANIVYIQTGWHHHMLTSSSLIQPSFAPTAKSEISVLELDFSQAGVIVLPIPANINKMTTAWWLSFFENRSRTLYD